MPDLLVNVIFDAANGWNEDSVMNSFAFRSDVPVEPVMLLDIKNAVASFYNGLATGQGTTIASYISSQIDRSTGGVALKTYDITGHLDGSPVGSPIDVDSFTLGTQSTQTLLPPTTAAVVTLRGRDAVSFPVEGPNNTRPRARRTGRLFLGPLSANAGSTANNTAQRPSSTFRGAVLAACEGLQDALVDGDYTWCVWSRATSSMHAIVRAEMDDSFDVLRSRKQRPTTRSVRTFAPEPSVVLAA